MSARGILTGDVLQVLKNGFVYTDPEKASRKYYKYAIEGRSPNSARTIRLIVIPDSPNNLKIITVMWKDES